MKDYQVLSEKGQVAIKKAVNDAINTGWQVQGGIAISQISIKRGTEIELTITYHQAMVKP